MNEDDFIQKLFAPLAGEGGFGLRDDAALLPVLPDGTRHVVTADMLVAGVHFFASDDPGDIAWKALAQNVSDLAAKAAKPTVYVLSLAAPDFSDADWFAAFAAGLSEAQNAFGIRLVGGDTARIDGPMVISITAHGSVPEGQYKSRLGARPGDQLFVTGSLGDAALGLKYHPDYAGAVDLAELRDMDIAVLLDRYRRPSPRIEMRDALRQHASACMDISDGLVKDARRMAQASGVSVRIDAFRVPLSQSYRNAGVGVEPALIGGDDFELLVAVSAVSAEAFANDAVKTGIAVSYIGTCMDGSGVSIVDEDGAPVSLAAEGYDHVGG